MLRRCRQLRQHLAACPRCRWLRRLPAPPAASCWLWRRQSLRRLRPADRLVICKGSGLNIRESIGAVCTVSCALRQPPYASCMMKGWLRKRPAGAMPRHESKLEIVTLTLDHVSKSSAPRDGSGPPAGGGSQAPQLRLQRLSMNLGFALHSPPKAHVSHSASASTHPGSCSSAANLPTWICGQ